MDSPAPPPELIWEHLGPPCREKVLVDGQTFLLDRPSGSDSLLDHPAVHSAFAKDEYMPYWADLWPAARMMAKVLIRESWVPGTEALEIGCGLGLPGIVGLSRGLKVVFSDYDICALRYADHNARLNGFDQFETLQLDWRHPPERKFPVILAADLIYELRNVAPIVEFIQKVLTPDGLCLLTDQDRIPALALKETLASQGLHFTTQIVRAGEPNGPRLKGTFYRVQRKK